MKQKFLRSMMAQKTILAPGVFDALSARLAERIGFEALYLSGAAQSVTQLGLPDVGHITLVDMVRVVKNIRRVSRLPLIVDVDTGFGGPQQIRRTVQLLENAGASAIQIEDQVFPKRCGHLSGKSLVTASQMATKIESAVSARKSKQFLIVARTDARGVSGLEDALFRAKIYRDSGADIIFPEALTSVDEFAVFGQKKNLGSLMANMTEFALSPALTAPQLARLGYSLVIFPMTGCRVAAHAMEVAFRTLKSKGTSRSFISSMQTRQDLYKLIDYQS